MNTKRIALLCAAGLLFAAQAFAQDFPAYLKMEGTVITYCDKTALPANLTIPEGVTEISAGAFTGCSSLASVSIPKSVKRIYMGAFVGCDNIKTVQYRGTLAQWCETDNDGFLVEYAKSIAMSDAADLRTMTALAIPKGVTRIGDFAFSNCKSLASVSIPKRVKSIGIGAFVFCTSLESVTIPKSVREIDAGAFLGCESLANVEIPASVKEIGWHAFDECELLKEVNFLGTIAQWQAFNVLLNPGAVVHCADGDLAQE